MNPETGEEWVRGCMATDLSDSWLNYRPDTPDSDWQRRTKEDICYNEAATLDDGSCDYVKGCTNKDATNYDKDANKDDDSCEVPTSAKSKGLVKEPKSLAGSCQVRLPLVTRVTLRSPSRFLMIEVVAF